MAHVFGDNEKESDFGYVYKVSGPCKCSLSLLPSVLHPVRRSVFSPWRNVGRFHFSFHF